MLQDLVNNEDPLCSRWILPVVQGYCQIVHCVNTFEEEEPDDLIEKNRGILPEEEFELILISRRCIHRAGTRYKRRGVDEDGEVANFVETEQIIRTEIHSVSFLQVRGSVPIYWSQPGFKYRPPPRLDRGEEDTLLAFMSHFAHQLKYYGGVVIINLLDQTGREKIIGDAFMDNILTFNNPLLTYVTYDFHEYCRGMKFENVAVLVDSIIDIIKDMRYCWTDSKGIICEQRSVFRVNCMDCLDRTNVVQAALARHVMEVQLRKLGKLLPDQNLPSDIRTSFQEMWANNGDAISRQYAGTAAMKGDFTRTGERRFAGVMKDGYNSANRYYLNRFKAVYRQTVIDAMLGNPLTEDLTQAMAALKNGDEEYPWTMEREECVAQLVMHCQNLLLSETEECLGGWALVDPFYNTEGELGQDQDVILLLTYDAYYVASYDDDAEQITQYERIALEDVDKIEIGFEASFKSRYLFIRIHYKYNGTSGYFHTLRTIQHRTPEEAKGVLLGIADAFATARSHKSLGIKISECNRLDKKRSKAPPEVVQISSKSRLSSWSKPNKRKSKLSPGDYEEDPNTSPTKKSPRTFRSFIRDHLTGMPRPYSDPCLARQDEAEEYKPERKRSGHSAPVSSGSSSSSNSDGEEGFESEGRLKMNLDQDKPIKSATKLECQSDGVLIGMSEDNEANSKKTELLNGNANDKTTNTSNNGTVEEFSGDKNTGSCSPLTLSNNIDKHSEDQNVGDVTGRSNQLIELDSELDIETPQEPAVPITEQSSEDQNRTNVNESTCKNDQVGQLIELDSELNSEAPKETDLPIVNITEQSNELERLQTIENPVEDTNVETQNDDNNDEADEAGTQPEAVIDLDEISKIRESYNESKRKLRDENADLTNIDEDDCSSQETLKSDVGSSPMVRLGLGGSLRSMAVSFKSSSSIEKGNQGSIGEEDTEQEVNKRNSTGFLGNRSPSTSRSGKGNIFASAQARSKNFIPDLRNKLSNISFQRTKSPRLAHKQHAVASDDSTVEEHKKHKRKYKCLTKIIEV
ncbi:phosphatidylinositide phosphatase SAC2 [Exaiptasia diaphana]|uniref:Phosphatidylinositide phosphatase SAC2 n=1 Tax=Exaiptasia diaphana TaxID=2652724 RepID=A0A913Y0F0_EXADI|nr:phosphatidylinositide phosphatase SAC2 [Exaiptasia diaphana]